MNRTQTLKTVLTTLALTAGTFGHANAASTNQVFISGSMILVFLGFCALVVAIQLIPAIKSLMGMIRETRESSREKTAATAKN